MIGRGPGAAYAACCSVAYRKLASELFFERAFYRSPLNCRSTDLTVRGKRNRDLRGQGLGDRVLIRSEGICRVRIQIERSV